jgi:hypothetical protein
MVNNGTRVVRESSGITGLQFGDKLLTKFGSSIMESESSSSAPGARILESCFVRSGLSMFDGADCKFLIVF